MYNICFIDEYNEKVKEVFGEKYDLSDDLSQSNVVVTSGASLSEEMLSSKLVFAVLDISRGAADIPEGFCSEHGIVIYRAADREEGSALNVRDYIENGNITGAVNFPDVSLGDFADDVSRISIVMTGIDDPILLGAMMFSGMDIKAVAGGTKKEYGYALVLSREAVMRVPHVDGVIKVRVLQDI